jgi:hypothetical protein
VAGTPVRLVESRSTADLVKAVSGWPCPVLVVDLSEQQTIRQLGDLDRALQVAPDALSAVLDRSGDHTVWEVAREIGATAVLHESQRPPELLDLLLRWLALARRRTERDGWMPPSATPDDPIDALLSTVAPGRP